jgi:hypothetical protein
MFSMRRFGLWVSVPRNDAALTRAAVEAGADVIKIHMAVEHRASGNSFGSLAEEQERIAAVVEAAAGRPVGLVTGGAVDVVPDLMAVKELGVSFVSMYAHHTPACWLSGRAPLPIMVAPNFETPLPLIGDLGASGIDMVEASVMPPTGYGQRLTVADLALYRYIRRAVPVPIVVPSQRLILPEDIPALAATGVDALMIGAVVTGQTEATIAAATAAFRRAVDLL